MGSVFLYGWLSGKATRNSRYPVHGLGLRTSRKGVVRGFYWVPSLPLILGAF